MGGRAEAARRGAGRGGGAGRTGSGPGAGASGAAGAGDCSAGVDIRPTGRTTAGAPVVGVSGEPGYSGSSGSSINGRSRARTCSSGMRRAGSLIISAETTSATALELRGRGTSPSTTSVIVATGSPRTS